METACRQWIELALTGTVATVVHERKSKTTSPQPPRPYASIRLLSDQPLSGIPYEVTTETADADEPEKFVQERSEKRAGTLQVNVFGEDAREILRALRMSVRHENVRALILAAEDDDGNNIDLAIASRGLILDTTELRGTSWDPSAQAEYRVTWVDRDVSAVPYIETVDTTGMVFE